MHHGYSSMNCACYRVAMDLGVCQLRHFSISFLSSLLGTDSSTVRLDERYIISVNSLEERKYKSDDYRVLDTRQGCVSDS